MWFYFQVPFDPGQRASLLEFLPDPILGDHSLHDFLRIHILIASRGQLKLSSTYLEVISRPPKPSA